MSNTHARNLRLDVQYDGTDFHGWQVQPGLPTIQGVLTQVVERVTHERIQVHGSGRTDAGVHALAQVCSFQTFSSIPPSNLQKALNALLPPTIRVNRVEEVPLEFHARRSAKLKHYCYRILNARDCSPFVYRYVHHHPRRLDFASLSQAAQAVLGEHDFSSFCDSDSEVESKVRTLVSSVFVFDTRTDLIEYNVCANGFLHHMVRNLAGTFLEVGKGRLAVDGVHAILHSRCRSKAGPTAPAKGLFLVSVKY
ncbi:MAG: tRNA pseudouridine(38-40) synthase TruA [Acidobacteriota bacterium]